MPTRPKRPCPHPGCPELVQRGRCPRHALQVERARGTTAQRGYGAHHRRWRAMILARDVLCVAPKCKRPATQADHIIPLSMGGTWALENGQGLCHHHHSSKTAREQRDPWLGMRMRASTDNTTT